MIIILLYYKDMILYCDIILLLNILLSTLIYYISISQNCWQGFLHGNLNYLNSLTSARQEHPGNEIV